MEGRDVCKQVRENIALNATQQPQYDRILDAGGERRGDFIFVPKPNSH